MPHISKSIDVNVPVQAAYNQWTQFEDFPRCMEGVKEVRQSDPKRLLWRAEIGGKEVTWTAEITAQDPDRLIAWRSTSGARNEGTVAFEAVSPCRTRITLHLDYDPEGPLQSTGSMLGAVTARVDGDLQRFQEFIEARGAPTGAWRGEIVGDVVHEPGAPRPEVAP
ncbi:MAG: SRPBCC family protein [Planctomycetota bacterium]|nr:MAG: SRPBCC family protein [Planctomycetota bacterium]